MQMHYQVAAEKAAILREETLEEDGKAEIMNNLTLTGAAIEDLCNVHDHEVFPIIFHHYFEE